MLERRSALLSLPGSQRQRALIRCPRLRMAEVRGRALVLVAAFANTLAELQQAVHPVLGMSLPQRVGTAVTSERCCLLRISATQFWIIAAEDHDPAGRLRTAVATQIGAVTPLSHSRVCIAIEGSAAGELLSMVVGLDFHPAAFAVGQFASTGLHHTPVLIHRVGSERFELHAYRTFAQSAWQWLSDAALPFEHPPKTETESRR